MATIFPCSTHEPVKIHRFSITYCYLYFIISINYMTVIGRKTYLMRLSASMNSWVLVVGSSRVQAGSGLLSAAWNTAMLYRVQLYCSHYNHYLLYHIFNNNVPKYSTYITSIIYFIWWAAVKIPANHSKFSVRWLQAVPIATIIEVSYCTKHYEAIVFQI